LAFPSRCVSAVRGCEEEFVAIATEDEFRSDEVAVRREDLRNSVAEGGEDATGTEALDSVVRFDAVANGCNKTTSKGGKRE
jgi:hypothetical protein